MIIMINNNMACIHIMELATQVTRLQLPLVTHKMQKNEEIKAWEIEVFLFHHVSIWVWILGSTIEDAYIRSQLLTTKSKSYLKLYVCNLLKTVSMKRQSIRYEVVP